MQNGNLGKFLRRAVSEKNQDTAFRQIRDFGTDCSNTRFEKHRHSNNSMQTFVSGRAAAQTTTATPLF